MNANQVVGREAAGRQPEIRSATKGVNETTGTVHAAHPVRDSYYRMPDGSPYYQLVQNCGMGHGQQLYLSLVPDGTPVTCKRCTQQRTP